MSNSKLSPDLKQKKDLIAAVRAESSLHNPKNSYLRSKNLVWNQVAAQCGIDRGDTAKFIWKNICDAYVSYLEKSNIDKHKEHFVLFKRLKFMDKYLSKNSTQTVQISGPDPKIISENSQSLEIKNESIKEIQNVVPLQIDQSTTNGEFTTIQYWNDTQKDENQKERMNTTNEIDCLEIHSDSDSNTESYEDIILPDATSNGNCNDKSLKMFFDAMFASTSQLPNRFQRMVKRKIFAAVLEAEEEAEQQN